MKYIPTIIFAIIEIIIVAMVLSNAEYANYEDVIAALCLIYATIRSMAIGFGMTINKLTVGLAADLIRIRERIRQDSDIEDEWRAFNTNNKNIEANEIKTIIRWVGVGIIYLISLAYLLG